MCLCPHGDISECSCVYGGVLSVCQGHVEAFSECVGATWRHALGVLGPHGGMLWGCLVSRGDVL